MGISRLFLKEIIEISKFSKRINLKNNINANILFLGDQSIRVNTKQIKDTVKLSGSKKNKTLYLFDRIRTATLYDLFPSNIRSKIVIKTLDINGKPDLNVDITKKRSLKEAGLLNQSISQFIDIGTLEHVINPYKALCNISELLKKEGLIVTIKKFHKENRPILAICLGFQMLFSSSDEFKYTKGLNLISGKVKSLKSLKIKKIVPNLGWNTLNIIKHKNNNLFKKISPKPSIYFIHSYYAEIENRKQETSNINFGGKKITTSIQLKNLYGVQFHPEKSGYTGLKIIQNFLTHAKNK